MKTKLAKKKYYQDLFEKNKRDLSKTWEAICCFVKMGRKSKRSPCSLKHQGVLIFNPEKIVKTFNFFFTNLDLTLLRKFLKEKNNL